MVCFARLLGSREGDRPSLVDISAFRGGPDLVAWRFRRFQEILIGGNDESTDLSAKRKYGGGVSGGRGWIAGVREEAGWGRGCSGSPAGESAGDGLSSAAGEGFGGPGDSDGGRVASVSAFGISRGEGDGW